MLDLSCSTQDLYLKQVGFFFLADAHELLVAASNSPTRDGTQAPCIRSLDHPEKFHPSFFTAFEGMEPGRAASICKMHSLGPQHSLPRCMSLILWIF